MAKQTFKISCKLIIETPWGILLVKDLRDKRGQRYSLPGGTYEPVRRYDNYNKVWIKKDKGRRAAAARELEEELKLVVVSNEIKLLYEYRSDFTDPRGQRVPRKIRVYIAKARNSFVPFFQTLRKRCFQKEEVGGIAFLAGKLSAGSARIPTNLLQDNVQVAIRNYVNSGTRRALRKQFFSDISIHGSVLRCNFVNGNWEKI